MVSVHRRVGAALVPLAALTLGACPSPGPHTGLVEGGISVTSTVPADIQSAGPTTTPSEAAAFAWNEFIALNWPAVPQTGAVNTRGVANDTATFGVPNDPRPLVWHTFRAKVEIFPPDDSTPNGYTNGTPANSFGYDSLPRYTYGSAVKPANGTPSTSVPWINLDETNEIGFDAMYAGVGTGQTSLNGLILFMAKANRVEYSYVAANQYFDSATVAAANATSSAFVVANDSSPLQNTTANGVSLPNGTIELKAAWRELTPAEAQSGRFYQTRVRYYPTGSTYQDATMGLVALHIIQKTPSRPYFVFATFEQADNILTPAGTAVEDEDGNLKPGYATLPPMNPVVTAQNARSPAPQGYDLTNIQQLGVTSTPGAQLYYVNTPATGEPDGIISVNRRVHGIPPEIVEANKQAHEAMAAYAKTHGQPPAVWQHYKLINVQYQPVDKPNPGSNYRGADSAAYYQANIVVETDQNLQTFSGRFQPSFLIPNPLPNPSVPDTINGGNLITDWCGSNPAQPITGCPPGANRPIHNVYTGGKAYNMGGCMGCHGNAQVAGGDFSFLLVGGPTDAPEPANAEQAPLNTQKFDEIFGKLGAVRAASRASPQRTVTPP